MPRTTRLLSLAALVLCFAQVPVHAATLPDRVTHGSVQIQQHYGSRCTAFTYSFTGAFLVGKKVWHGTLSATYCAYALPDAIGLPYVLEPRLYGASADGEIYAPCHTNATFTPALWSYAPSDPAAWVCTASLDGAFPLPVAFDMKVHSTGHGYTGSFYGA